MPLRERPDPRSSLWDLLASHLHFLRVKHGLSCAAVGELVNASRQTVSHWESGLRKPHEWQVKILDKKYETGTLLEYLLYHAKREHNPSWFADSVEYEGRATEIRIAELSWIHGLFQTEAYARAVFREADFREIDHLVETRMKRRQVLDREDPPLIWLLLDQGALEQPVGGSSVMYEQLSHLLELAERPNITIRIVPRSAGGHPGRNGSFKIMTVDREDRVYIEASEGGRLVQDHSEVRSFRVRFERIGDRALPVDASITLIKEVMERFK
ncbi:helix-turn-helix domain-containing protein [Thermomonospora curvata]|uniref:HTH cro/C1-type domain-containing protein n=1 Tax=Thermomonospora curvata (strain ATCC 19995 / DSM 43183 / JCM 3096 / KCTC 9072 / NBRC 15933 / NCIMB 10081 / Henssen B9) TaxID=471852 RepID=D1A793_THECD|nr:helix-turn-helix transcriptional regulator [Thermomonospora curvata]ACZ00299.1 hypothetical protein Tcur_4780 [Thermomonospora curvata DSM 43183]